MNTENFQVTIIIIIDSPISRSNRLSLNDGPTRLSLNEGPMLMLKLVANAELKVMLSLAFSLSSTETSPANPIISSK